MAPPVRQRHAAGFVAQLANYGAPPTRPAESGWADLRAAQAQAVARDPHMGLAVTIDIGDRYDIHPTNKQELGAALPARSAMSCSGHRSRRQARLPLPPAGSTRRRSRSGSAT
ncbi:hypothetical protein [Hankyongella ginsenosidimutans]|uniref:hypothetical protein n=1 Tax=Hankyongella ginsenosidimutans TaxID=1763828 RepID=UPI001FEB1E18|nr:hypothetical protein [Hankyongella ginsenosidimutans]